MKAYDSSFALSRQEITSGTHKQNKFLSATQNSKFLKIHNNKFSYLQGACSYFSLNGCIPPPQLGPDFIFGACIKIE